MRLVLDSITDDDIILTASELVPLPDDQRAWIDGALGDAELISDTHARTRTGWPVRIVITRAGDTWRAHGFYAFFEHAAMAVLSAPSQERLSACTGVLASGAPRWTTGVAALAELWDVPGRATET